MSLDEMAWFLNDSVQPESNSDWNLSLSFIVKMNKINPNLWRLQTAILFELRKHLILTQFSGKTLSSAAVDLLALPSPVKAWH